MRLSCEAVLVLQLPIFRLFSWICWVHASLIIVLGHNGLSWPGIHICLYISAEDFFFSAICMCVPLLVPANLDVSRFCYVRPQFWFQFLLVDQSLTRYPALLLLWTPQRVLFFSASSVAPVLPNSVPSLSLSTPVILSSCHTPVISPSFSTPVLSVLLSSFPSFPASAEYWLFFSCGICDVSSCISASKSTPEIFLSILLNASFALSSGQISLILASVRFSKISPLFCFSWGHCLHLLHENSGGGHLSELSAGDFLTRV